MGKYLKIDEEGLIELFELYKDNYYKFAEELDKYDKQLFMYEFNNLDLADDKLKEFYNIYKFMGSVFSLINAEQDLF